MGREIETERGSEIIQKRKRGGTGGLERTPLLLILVLGMHAFRAFKTEHRSFSNLISEKIRRNLQEPGGIRQYKTVEHVLAISAVMSYSTSRCG